MLFLIGGAMAAALFVFFGWDLAHHYTAYSPDRHGFPWAKIIFLVPWAVVLAMYGSRWLRKQQAASWPSAASRIESGSVGAIPRRGGRCSYLLSIAYSYTVDGETYGGVHSEILDTESDAQSVLASLKALPPLVRYKPEDPMESEMLL